MTFASVGMALSAADAASATPPPPTLVGGSNQTQVGIYNERLLLDCVRRTPRITASELARATHLSAQTVTVIVNRLLAAGLLQKQARRVTKRAGQPAVPLVVCGEGAFALGAKIGRTRSETMLVDFNGEVRAHALSEHAYPDAAKLLPWIQSQFASYRAQLKNKQRLIGAGVSTFFGFGGWRDIFPMPKRAITRWTQTNIAEQLSAAGEIPIWLINDASAACLAELEFGKTASSEHLLYFHIGTFVGGGVVLNRRVFLGSNGNAGALASLPIQGRQLTHFASVYLLKQALAARGFDEAVLAAADDDKPRAARAIINRWRKKAAGALAQAIASAVAVMDFSEVMIAGILPEGEQDALIEAVEGALSHELLIGLVRPRLLAGCCGRRASCLGAAWSPIYARYAPAQTLLLKNSPQVAI